MADHIESIFQNRKHPVYGIKLIDGQPTIAFDTVCTKDRKKWLASDEVHSILKDVWIEADSWLME